MLNKEFVNEQNPWWTDARLIENDEKVKVASNNKLRVKYTFPMDENLLILGPRQVGKTTFMKLAILDLLTKRATDPRNILFFSCETLSGKEDIVELVQYFDGIGVKGRKHVFLDEITFAEDWNIGLLALFNSRLLRDKTIWVTGSSSISLQRETLPGRGMRKMVFYPLDFKAYADLFYGSRIADGGIDIGNMQVFYDTARSLMPHLNVLRKYFESYAFVTGGILPVAFDFFNDDNRKDPFDRHYDTYRDAVLSDLSKVGLNERIFRETLYGLLASYGSRYSSNGIARMTSIGSHKTVESYIDAMEKLFILNTIFKKENGRVVYRSNRKSCFTDPFIYRVLRFYSTGTKTVREADKPAILKGIVGAMLIRRYGDAVNYMHTKSGKEVDFVQEETGVEVKYGSADISDLNCKKGYVVTGGSDLRLDGTRLLIPAPIFLYLV